MTPLGRESSRFAASAAKWLTSGVGSRATTSFRESNQTKVSAKAEALTLTILHLKSNPLAFGIATCLGIGSIPGAPGTYGSAVGVLLAGLLWNASPHSWTVPLAAAVACGLGVWSGTQLARSTGLQDPRIVVIDEIAGQFLTLSLVPFSWRAALVGFALFRFFDIVKPFPARRAERLPEGWGILLDDLVAGVYAMLALWLLVPRS